MYSSFPYPKPRPIKDDLQTHLPLPQKVYNAPKKTPTRPPRKNKSVIKCIVSSTLIIYA